MASTPFAWLGVGTALRGRTVGVVVPVPVLVERTVRSERLAGMEGMPVVEEVVLEVRVEPLMVVIVGMHVLLLVISHSFSLVGSCGWIAWLEIGFSIESPP
jgi:hypothetical protein